MRLLLIVISFIYLINYTNSKKSCSSYNESECLNNKDDCYLSKISSCCDKDHFVCLQIPHKYCSPEELVPLPINIGNEKLSINTQDDNLLDEKQIISQNNHEWCLKKKNSILRFNSSCVPESNKDNHYFKPNKYKCKFTKCLKGFKCVDNDHDEFHKKCDSISNPCCSYQSKCIPTKDAHPLDVPITKTPKGNELKELIIRNLNNQNSDLKENNGQNESNNHHNKNKHSKKKHESNNKQPLNTSTETNDNNNNKHNNNNNNKHNNKHNNHKVHIKNSSNKEKENSNNNQLIPKSIYKDPSAIDNANNNQNPNNNRVTLNPKIIFKDKSNAQHINNNNNLNPRVIYKDPLGDNQHKPPVSRAVADNYNQHFTNKKLLSIEDTEQAEEFEQVEYLLNKDEEDKNKKRHKKDKHSKNKHKKHNDKKKKNDKSHTTKEPKNTNKPSQTPVQTHTPAPETPTPVTETPTPVTETPTHPPRQTSTPNPCINALCPEGSKCFVRDGKPFCRLSNFPSSLRGLKMLLRDDEFQQTTSLTCQNLPCPAEQICYLINNLPVCKARQPQKLEYNEDDCNSCPPDTSSCNPKEDGKGVICRIVPVTCGIVQCPEGKYCMDNTQDLSPKCYDKMNCTTLKAPKGYRCQPDDIRGAIFVKYSEPALSCANVPCPSNQICYLDNKSTPKCKPKPQQKLTYYENSCSNCPSGTSVCGPREDKKPGVVCTIVPLTCGIVQCDESYQFCMDNTEDLSPNCYDKMNCSNVKAPLGYKCQPDDIRGGIFIKK